MRKPPAAGRKVERPVRSAAVMGARIRLSPSARRLPTRIPPAPSPSMPRKRRLPIGVPAASSITTSLRRRRRYRTAPLRRGPAVLVAKRGALAPLFSPNSEFVAEDPAGAEVDDAGGQLVERLGGLVAGGGHGDGEPYVAALAEFGHERHLAEERHAQLVGQRGAAAGPEQLVTLP